MTREQQDAVIAALDRADLETTRALGELAGKLVKIERERRERIMRAIDAANVEGSTEET